MGLGISSLRLGLHARGLGGPVELIENTEFADATGWTGVRANLSVSSGKLVVTGSANYPGAYCVVQTVAGVVYRAQITFSANAGDVCTFFLKNGTTDSADAIQGSYAATSDPQTVVVDFLAAGENTTIFVIANTPEIKTFQVSAPSVMRRGFDSWQVSVPTGTPVILDVDLDTDVGDVAGLAIAIAMHNRGEINLIGVLTSSSHIYSAPCARAILDTYGLTSVPVGAYQGSGTTNTSTYAETIADEFGYPTETRADFDDGTTLLRQLLADADDDSVVIVTIGFFTNVNGLLATTADGISALNGSDLMAAKVRHVMTMAGDYFAPDVDLVYTEWNFDKDPANAANFVANCPVPIIFLGYTQGGLVASGPPSGANPATNPIKRAFNLAGYVERTAWDQSGVLILRCTNSGFSLVNGATVSVNASTGDNTFKAPATPLGTHSIAVMTDTAANVKAVQNGLIAEIGP